MQFKNRCLRSLRPYPLASHKIWTVTPEERADMLKLDWNEATEAPSPRVAARIRELAGRSDFYNIYPSTTNPELQGLLSRYTGAPEENLLYFAGSDAVHECIVRVFIAAGDPVLLLGPTYDNFRLTAEAAGAKITVFEVDSEFRFDAAAFEAQLDALKPSFVYICSPNNPTGYCHSVEYLESLAGARPDTMFLIDEAYYEFSGVTAKELALSLPNVLVTRTMSKAFAIANFRFGYVLSCTENIKAMSVVRNPKNISTFTQAAAMGVLEDTQHMWNYVERVRAARDVFYQQLLDLRDERIKPYYGYGNFLLVKLPSQEERDALMAHFKADNIFVRPMYQSPMLYSCVRISIGTQEQMERVFRSLSAFLQK